MEIMTGFKRAGKMSDDVCTVDYRRLSYICSIGNMFANVFYIGTDVIMTYFAKDIAKWLAEK